MQKSPAWERISRFYTKTLIPAIFNIMKSPDYWTFTEVSSFDGNIIIRLHIYCHTTASRSQSVSPVKKIKIPGTSLEAQLGTWKLNWNIIFFICIPMSIENSQTTLLISTIYFLQWVSMQMQSLIRSN